MTVTNLKVPSDHYNTKSASTSSSATVEPALIIGGRIQYRIANWLWRYVSMPKHIHRVIPVPAGSVWYWTRKFPEISSGIGTNRVFMTAWPSGASSRGSSGAQ
uniref:(northern house mosquito) hypothetical protein n=1 Tax=Culex pipiens TaxID=7175 RepID=A0A8D8J4A8_CULPI